MPTSGITRSDLVRVMMEVGQLLTGPKPFDERMAGLCSAATAILNCDQLTVYQLDGDYYRVAFHHGLPDHVVEHLPNHRVPRTADTVQRIEACENYMLLNSTADEAERLQRAADSMGVRGVIIVPLTHPNGKPLGYMTAGYNQDKPNLTSEEAEIACGIGRMAETTLLRRLETERRREISRAMLDVADSERRRLSRDIHDDPLQRILGLRIGLEGLRGQLDDPAMVTKFDDFIDQCRSASASLREVMLRTHPNASELAELQDVLTAMIARQERSQVRLEFVDNRAEDSPSHLVPALNRVAEQAARNTIHHAQATILSVTLTDELSGTRLTVADDGKGFCPEQVDSSRLGLLSMRERSELLGGTFHIDSSPGNGTVVSAWFPHKDLVVVDPLSENARAL